MLEAAEVHAAGAAPVLLRREGGPEGGSPADDCRDTAAGVAEADAAADAAADVGTEAEAAEAAEAASDAPKPDAPPGTKNAGGTAAAGPLAANAPADLTGGAANQPICIPWSSSVEDSHLSTTPAAHDGVPVHTWRRGEGCRTLGAAARAAGIEGVDIP